MAGIGVRGNRGGAKGRSGRKSKAEELGLAALLDECWTEADRKACLKKLASNARTGDMESIKLLMAYAYGKPVDRKEIKGADDLPVIVREIVIERAT